MDNNKLQITTLDDIRVLRKQALLNVQQQKKVLGTTARKLIAPLAPTVNKGNSIIRLSIQEWPYSMASCWA